MKDVIILFTPTHTGTHFVKMLLESHPEIGVAIGEDFRIDSAFRPNHVLAGLGAGWIDPALDPGRDRSCERMLLEYFRDFLRGDLDKKAFQKTLEYWQGISSEKKLPLRHYDHHLIGVREGFRSLGIELALKRERYLLYRGHCHGEYQAYDLARLTQAFPVVVTVRHPLLSILSLMRRNPRAHHESLIDSYLAGMRCLFSLTGAFLFCTDLWQDRPEQMETVFGFLALSVSSAGRQFLALRPRINNTVSKGEIQDGYNNCLEYGHSPDFLKVLQAAREMLDERRCHPLLEPYWARVEEAGLRSHYERLGYAAPF